MTTIGDLYNQHNQQQMGPQMGSQMTPQEYQNMLMYQQMMEQENARGKQDDLDVILNDINQNTEEEEVEEKKSRKRKRKDKVKLIDYAKEIGLLVAVYVLLSNSAVKSFFSAQIPQLNKNADGKIPLSGLIIYGIVLGTIFVVARRYFLK